MCGIAAIYSNDQNILGKIDKIIKKINYRGPDDMGSLQLNKNFSVGSCRLSIFDVSEKGKMPMKDSSNNYTIVYNGEIYNFPEIKKKFNISTKSGTDTEVILELYLYKLIMMKIFILPQINVQIVYMLHLEVHNL